MRTINNKLKSIFTVAIVSVFMLITSCDGTDLDVNVNPNALSPESADPSLVLNGIQTTFINSNFAFNSTTRGVMRHINMFGTYANNAPSSTMNGVWANSYAISANTKLLSELNETLEIANHLGAAQLMEAYNYVNLVDYIGTAVFTEAVDPDIAAPNLDAGADIYNALYEKLNEAIANLSVPDQVIFEDLFFEGDASDRINNWIKVANTLKIRMYVQSKLVGNANATSEINNIIASGMYISDKSDDFQAKFGTNNANPDVRHPDYLAGYVGGAGGTYMSNEFMNILLNDKSIQDPRLRFYVYRQSLADPTGSLLPCDGNANYNFCYLERGYWGRDHADDEGIPNDGNLRSTFGVYPAGGAFDDRNVGVITQNAIIEYNGFTVIPVNPDTDLPYTENEWVYQTLATPIATANNPGLGGAGIYPMILSSFTDFYLAEASLPSPAGLGVSGSPITYLENAIRKSFAKVYKFSEVAIDQTAQTAIDTYVSEVLTVYGNATTDQERLSVIMKEFYIASWGNSVESYNGYRRTGFPELGGSVINNTDFPRNYLIPDSELNSNDNPDIEQITRTTKVFWDTNPDDFIK